MDSYKPGEARLILQAILLTGPQGKALTLLRDRPFVPHDRGFSTLPKRRVGWGPSNDLSVRFQVVTIDALSKKGFVALSETAAKITPLGRKALLRRAAHDRRVAAATASRQIERNRT